MLCPPLCSIISFLLLLPERYHPEILSIPAAASHLLCWAYINGTHLERNPNGIFIPFRQYGKWIAGYRAEGFDYFPGHPGGDMSLI